MEPVSDEREAALAPEESGADLMIRVRSGDAEAFAALVERYQKGVLNTVYRCIGNRATAEELTQDVFVRVYRARWTYEPKARFETWLYRIVFNLCANAAGVLRRRRTLSLDVVADQEGARGRPGRPLADPAARPPVESIERAELAAAVRRAIAALPDQQRAALILSRYQEMPHVEIAAVLETSVEAVKSLLFRAREKLRVALTPYLQEEVRDEL